jgi:hypothetical protein
MNLLRQYVRTILEVRSSDDERSDTYKIIKLFLGEEGTLQAMDLASVLPNADETVIDMMNVLEERVAEIVEYGRGNFPEHWNPGGGRAIKELSLSDYEAPARDIIKKLKEKAQEEINGPGHDQEFSDIGKMANDFVKQFRYAVMAVNAVIAGEYTPEEIMKDAHSDGKHLVTLAERFGLDYEPAA